MIPKIHNTTIFTDATLPFVGNLYAYNRQPAFPVNIHLSLNDFDVISKLIGKDSVKPILTEFAQIVSDTASKHKFHAFRYGGSEFRLIGDDLDHGLLLARELRANLKNSQTAPSIVLSVSMGLGDNKDTASQALKMAQEQLRQNQLPDDRPHAIGSAPTVIVSLFSPEDR